MSIFSEFLTMLGVQDDFCIQLYSPYFCPHRALQGHNRSATSKTRISKQLLMEIAA
ncbi:MAG: hypothetical protein BECKG1743D_GA0114223_102204 [Candidatus Kentron sp. G]|nr:MAG: hypothetical protein BECKG1743D_GA0114223_102204 [Candidatus Kentron sp. G]